MVMIKWDDSLRTGISRVDAQHRTLVDIINEAYEALTAERTESFMLDVVNKLREYTRQHFATEESLMEQYGYPAIAEHKSEHSYFTQKTQELEATCRSGEYAGPAEVLGFLTVWLTRHIKGTDKMTCDYLKQRDVS